MCRRRLKGIQYPPRAIKHLWRSRAANTAGAGAGDERCFIGRFMERRKMGGSGSVSPVRQGVYIEEK